jgi:predicted porin
MKKSLVALAVLAASGAAMAQSSVTLYGTVDGAFTKYTANNGVSKTGLGNSQLGSSLIGFRGSEDLGGGMKAEFKLEGGLANDIGAGKASSSNNQSSGGGVTAGAATGLAGSQGLAFARYSHVGLVGSFGEIRLGRDYTSTFQWGVAAVDPFGTNGPADASQMLLNLGTRNLQATTSGASNMIGYITPNVGGFEAKVQTFYGENASNAALGGKSGDGSSVAVRFSNATTYLSASKMTTKGAVAAATATAVAANGEYTQTGYSASYNFGPAKAIFTRAGETLVKAAGKSTNDSNEIGLIVPMGAANFKVAQTTSTQNTGVAGVADTKGTLMGVGVDYSLSKRTVAYGTYSRVSNKDGGTTFSAGNSALGTAANYSSTGLAIGVLHRF